MSDITRDQKMQNIADARARMGNDANELYQALANSAEQLANFRGEIELLRKDKLNVVERLNALHTEVERLRSENEILRNSCKFSPVDFLKLQEENARLQAFARQPHDEVSGSRIRQNAITIGRSELWSSQRVAVLVDVQNMYYSAKKIYNSKISFQKLLPAVLNNRQLIRAISYTVEKEGADQEKFYEMLRHTGFEIKRRDLIVRSDGSRKGDWDMGIAIDAISLIDKVDVVVLVTGDGDFVALVNMLKGRGVRVEVASFRESTAESLVDASSEHYIIDQEWLVD